MVGLLFNVLFGVVAGGFHRSLQRYRKGQPWQALDFRMVVYLWLVLLTLAAAAPGDVFVKMQGVCWFLFLHAPLHLLVFARRLAGNHRTLQVVLLVGVAGLTAVGVDAFLIEPQALEVTHRRLVTSKVERPLRIAVLADIQTDAPGAYDRRVLARVKAEHPDLILFAGDYIHIEAGQAYRDAARKLNRLLQEAGLDPSLGKIAVQGNIDNRQPWETIFVGTDTQVYAADATLDVGPVVVTVLSMAQSYGMRTAVPAQDKYHIVLGHVPNYALGDIQADLLLAGHTHGGQVRLPFIGPLLTYTEVPRAWAAGQTEIAPGRTLIVSRGIGLEREHAPRIRFLCRPELVIVDLVPERNDG